MTDMFCDWPKDYEAQFWASYPRKVAKGAMRKALDKIKNRGDVPWQKLLDGIERYKAWLAQRSAACWRPEPAHASTWLNQERWDDEFGGDYHEANRSISAAASALTETGFRIGPKPRDILLESGRRDVPLLPQK